MLSANVAPAREMTVAARNADAASGMLAATAAIRSSAIAARRRRNKICRTGWLKNGRRSFQNEATTAAAIAARHSATKTKYDPPIPSPPIPEGFDRARALG